MAAANDTLLLFRNAKLRTATSCINISERYSSNVSNGTLALSWTVNIKVQILPCRYSVQLTRISILLKLVLPFSAIVAKESAQSPKFLIPESAATGMSDISRRVHSIKRESTPESV